MTLEEMREALNVNGLSKMRAEELRSFISAEGFPDEHRSWAFECVQILENVPGDF